MDKTDEIYNSEQDYCSEAEKKQSVLSYDETKQNLSASGTEPSDAEIRAKRESTQYSCNDNYTMGTIQDGKIYIATTDYQHQQIVNNEKVTANGGLSGYFSDQATVDACKDGDTLDNSRYNQMNQIAPYREGGMDGKGDASYKPHVDCFEINPDALRDNYQTDDFNAAIGKCQANNQFGEGGGNQGYNPHIDEMIANGTLTHKPKESYSDKDLSKLGKDQLNEKKLTNSTVSEDDYVDMMENAETRAKDCVKNNTPHPSDEARQNGFKPNEEPIPSNTGNAVPVRQAEKETSDSTKTEPTPKANGNTGHTQEIPSKAAANSSETENTANVPNTRVEATPKTNEDNKTTSDIPAKASNGSSHTEDTSNIPNTKAADKSQTTDNAANSTAGRQTTDSTVPSTAHTPPQGQTSDGDNHSQMPATNTKNSSSAPPDNGKKSETDSIQR